MTEPLPEAVGGYFATEPCAGSGEYFSAAYRYQSARAAFLDMLLHHKPVRVWMPWYICDSMLEPLRMAGVACARYLLDDDLHIESPIQLEPGEWLLYANYFGLQENYIDTLLADYPPGQVLIDQSQAFFSAPRACLANLYSPRKFFGVPDGAYLLTGLDMPAPETEDEASFARGAYLGVRAAEGPEAGYAAYRAAEAQLSGQRPMRMSRHTRHLLSDIDYAAVRARRLENFRRLHARLHVHNRFTADAAGCVPLCYPLRVEQPGLREALLAERVFVPRYWAQMGRHVPARIAALADTFLPLPCDQRYREAQMDRVSALVCARLGQGGRP